MQSMNVSFPISLVLLNCKRFSVECSYNPDVIGVCRTISSRQYNPATKTWNFEFKDYTKLVSSLRSLPLNIKLQEIPTKVLEVLRQINNNPLPNAPCTVDLSVIGPALNKSLMPFQREGVLFGIRQSGKVLIADDMGLGKTLQALGIASYYKNEWPLMIICPSSVRMAWLQAVLRWVPTISESDVNVVLKGTDDPTQGLVNILSYDLLTKLKEKVKRKQIQVFIADESHYLKSAKAARTKAIVPILKAAHRVVLLSGTPALSRPEELFMQINIINPRIYPSFVPFAYRYCNAKKTPFGLDSSGSSNLEELKIVLENKVMIRRLKNEVMNELPEKLRQVVTLDTSLVNVRNLEDGRQKVTEASKKERHGALLEYFHATGAAKIKAVSEYVQDLLEKKNKFLLFGHHQVMLDAMEKLLERKTISFIRIDGSTSAKDRHRNVEIFQEDPSCQVALLSILSTNLGLTLTAATVVVFAELYWNPGALVQAEDRAFRIGQKNAVTIVYLMAKKTADDFVWPLVQEKLQVLANAGLTQGNQLDADVSSFQDPKQKQILDFFQELAVDSTDDSMKESLSDSPSTLTSDGMISNINPHTERKLHDFFPVQSKATSSFKSEEHLLFNSPSIPHVERDKFSTCINESNSLESICSFPGDSKEDVLIDMDDDFDDILLSVDEGAPPPKKKKF